MESLTRNTAYKIWIADLVSGNYSRGEGQFDAGYVDFNGKKISRVNLICGVVDKLSGEGYSSLTLDDGSGTIQLKAWAEDVNIFLGVDIGDLVLVVGKVKDYNNSRYVVPEVVRKMDNPLWLKVRKQELVKEYGKPRSVGTTINSNFDEKNEEALNIIEEKIQDKSSLRETVLSLVESLDTGEGVELDRVIGESGMAEAKNIVQELVNDGEVFEFKKGRFRLVG